MNDADDLEHDRRLKRAPKQEIGVKGNPDVEVLFLFIDPLCTKPGVLHEPVITVFEGSMRG